MEPSARKSDITLLDTFVLIHSMLDSMATWQKRLHSNFDVVLYRFVNDTLSIKLCRSNRSAATLAEDAIITDVVHALDRWHRLWADLRNEAKQRGQWDDLGFFKNGDQYEAATRLLLSDEAQPILPQLLAADADRLVLLQRLNSRTSVV